MTRPPGSGNLAQNWKFHSHLRNYVNCLRTPRLRPNDGPERECYDEPILAALVDWCERCSGTHAGGRKSTTPAPKPADKATIRDENVKQMLLLMDTDGHRQERKDLAG